jgi:Na+/proline symporter
MHAVDLVLVALYFAAMLAVGFWFTRRAGTGLDSYFLGDRRLPWWTLAMSGAVSNFDITGTMWIVAMIVQLGLRSMWVHWIWGFLAGAFLMVYMGRWVRRSGVMTAAEWMRTRFGDDRGGRAARLASAVLAIVLTIAAISYAFQGIGKFTAVYLPIAQWFDPATPLGQFVAVHEAAILAGAIMGLTTIYVLFGGLFSVVVTDVIQTVILTAGGLVIAIIAWRELTPEALAALPADFADLTPRWRLGPGTLGDGGKYELFGAFVMVWVCKGLLLNLGGPGQVYDAQRFLAARDERDAAKIGAAWSLFLVVRWGMAMGIALLALTVGDRGGDAERAMPLVLRDFVPAGLRGLVLAGLLAAFMSTFSSTVNSGAAIVVRDLWQPLRGDMGHRANVRASYGATLGLVALGVACGALGESIDAIWQWMMMALCGGVVVPNVLRWHWWRLNGWGYTIGTAAGVLPAVALLLPTNRFTTALEPPYVSFPIIVAASTLGCLCGSWATRPTAAATLAAFHASVRPFGAWRGLGDGWAFGRGTAAGLGRTIANVLLAGTAIGALYLAPMFLVGHWYLRALLCLAVTGTAALILRVTWYRHLPAPAGR